MVDKVFPFLVSADSDSLLREELVTFLSFSFSLILLGVSIDHLFDFIMAHVVILVDIPDLQNPIGVESIDSATSLVANHIDNRVVLQRRASSKVHGVRHLFSCSHIELTQLVLGVEEHDLTKGVNGLKRLGLYSLNVEVEL